MSNSFGVAQDKKYWLGFSAFPGIGPRRFTLLLDYFKTAESAWNAQESELKLSGVPSNIISQFVNFRTYFNIKRYEEELEQKNVSVLYVSDDAYPALLKELSDPPFVLYVKGSRESVSALHTWGKTVAVVGTRKVTSYGAAVTRSLTEELVLAGCTIVSGLAFGVDSIAHRTTLDCKGKTVAVLGCGVDQCYPSSNQRLYEEIIQSGSAIVSEYPIGTSPNKGSFPARNRIIAGLSLATLVTEGAADSGALITAKEARELGRNIFAVPGPITSPLSKGPNSLLGEGATLVTNAEVILHTLGLKTPKIRTRDTTGSVPRGDTAEEQKIIALLQNEDLSFDEIVKKTDFGAVQLGALLSIMEVKGLITKNNSGVFVCP